MKNRIKSLSLVLAAVAIAVGCSKKKFDINSNPDDVSAVSATAVELLPGALQATASNIASEYWFLGWWMGHGARSGSYQTFNEEETYRFTNDFHVAIWNNLYSNANNYHLMIQKAEASGAGIYEAIGRAMKAHNMATLVDIYNNVPYSEAFQGTLKATPKYDKAIDIYKAQFDELDKAMAKLNDAAAITNDKNPDIAKTDIMFNGNVTKWKKFVNTLRLRLLIHLHNGVTTTTVAPGIDVAAQVAKFSGDGFLGAGESAQVNPGFQASKPQPYFRFFNTNESGTSSQRDWARASEYAIEYYKYDGDPRISRFYVAPSAGHKGIPFGTPSGGSAPTGGDLSTVRGPGLSPSGAASPAWILTSTESLFLQAEARQRGIITTGASAQALLTAAVQESFVSLGLTAANANTYIANNAGYPDVDYTAPSIVAGQPGGGLYTILSQKWFALNTFASHEIWTDWRRTDIVYGLAGTYDAGPTLSVDPGVQSTVIPRRLLYPQSEYNYNAANVAGEGTVNVFTGKIFWDLN